MTQTVLQISDCHLVVAGTSLIGVDTQASLDAVLSQALSQHQPDAIVATGDIAHDPARDVYQRFLHTVDAHTDVPLMVVPGNHDVLGVMQATDFPLAPITLEHWTLLGIDSHEDELPRANITSKDLDQSTAWLTDAVTRPNLLAATHHPLIGVNCPWLDIDRIQNPQGLADWLTQRSSNTLRGFVFGHAHQIVEATVTRTAHPPLPIWGAPSTCFQFAPGSQKFTIGAECPGYRWLFLHDDGSITTQVCRAEDFAINVDLTSFSG